MKTSTDETKRRKVTETHKVHWDYKTLGGIVEDLKELIDTYGEEARFTVDTYEDYGDTCVDMGVIHQVDESDSQYAVRMKSIERAKAWELKQYETLKKKFETNG